jgi:transcriptional regulator with XRE-family HTH domain
MEVRSLVAWNLRRLRVEKGISQDDLALIAGVERAYVGHLERGTRNPTIATLEKLAIALDRHISEFFSEPAVGSMPVTTLKAGRKKA